MRASLVAFAFAFALALAAPVQSLAAPQVLVTSLASGRVDLFVDGKALRVLREGERSPEGVLLVSATRSTAVLEIDGQQYTLGLGQSNVASVTLRPDARGAYTTVAYVNGTPFPAIIDTGATAVALSADAARALGIDYQRGTPGVSQTAAGQRRAWGVVLPSVRIGDIELGNVAAAVLDVGQTELPLVLIGMSYLKALEMQRSGDTLTLTRRR
jgi:aspartyl protease family protein